MKFEKHELHEKLVISSIQRLRNYVKNNEDICIRITLGKRKLDIQGTKEASKTLKVLVDLLEKHYPRNQSTNRA